MLADRSGRGQGRPRDPVRKMPGTDCHGLASRPESQARARTDVGSRRLPAPLLRRERLHAERMDLLPHPRPHRPVDELLRLHPREPANCSDTITARKCPPRSSRPRARHADATRRRPRRRSRQGSREAGFRSHHSRSDSSAVTAGRRGAHDTRSVRPSVGRTDDLSSPVVRSALLSSLLAVAVPARRQYLRAEPASAPAASARCGPDSARSTRSAAGPPIAPVPAHGRRAGPAERAPPPSPPSARAAERGRSRRRDSRARSPAHRLATRSHRPASVDAGAGGCPRRGPAGRDRGVAASARPSQRRRSSWRQACWAWPLRGDAGQLGRTGVLGRNRRKPAYFPYAPSIFYNRATRSAGTVRPDPSPLATSPGRRSCGLRAT